MSNTETVSARVPKELKERAKELGINISSVTREALREEVEMEEKKRLRKKAERAGKVLEDVPSQKFVKNVRESRDNR